MLTLFPFKILLQLLTFCGLLQLLTLNITVISGLMRFIIAEDYCNHPVLNIQYFISSVNVRHFIVVVFV